MQNNIFDPAFSSLTHAEMYRSWVIPELYPDEPQPRLNNWSDEDLVAYCGGAYAKEAYAK